MAEVLTRKRLLIAASVAVVGAGVYLAIAVGGRGDAPVGSAAPAPAVGGSASPPTARAGSIRPTDPPALPATAPAVPSAPIAPTATIVEDPALAASASEERAVADWIAQRKNEWVTACWPAPAPDRDPPDPTTVRLRAVFEADGRLRAHALTAEGQREVSRCLSALPFDPAFAGRGQRVDLALTFQFP